MRRIPPRCYLALALAILGCESKKPAHDQPVEPVAAGSALPTATLVDLATLDPVRVAFNAKKGEARFLTLLSPT